MLEVVVQNGIKARASSERCECEIFSPLSRLAGERDEEQRCIHTWDKYKGKM